MFYIYYTLCFFLLSDVVSKIQVHLKKQILEPLAVVPQVHDHLGINTESMTWITPFVHSMSG